MDRRLANRWLSKAEVLARLERLPDGGWHTLRQKAATEFKEHRTRTLWPCSAGVTSKASSRPTSTPIRRRCCERWRIAASGGEPGESPTLHTTQHTCPCWLSATEFYFLAGSALECGRGGRIRTGDPLLPKRDDEPPKRHVLPLHRVKADARSLSLRQSGPDFRIQLTRSTDPP